MKSLPIATYVLLLLSAAAHAEEARVAFQKPNAPAPAQFTPGKAITSIRLPGAEQLPAGRLEEELTLSSFEAMGLSNSPSIGAAGARYRAAQGQWLQVGLMPNPVAGYVGSEIGNDGRGGQQGGFVAQEVVTGGKLRLNRAVAAAEVRIAAQQLDRERYRLLNDVRISFYNTLVAQEKLRLSNELLQIGERSVDTVTKLLQGEIASKVELYQARVEANSARILRENARNDHLAAWKQLVTVSGVPELEVRQISGDLRQGVSDIRYEAALQDLLSRSPELQAAQQGIVRAQRVLGRARVEPVPNVELMGSLQHDNASGYDIAGVQIGVPLPIVNRNQGAIRQAVGELQAAQAEARRVELELQSRLAVVFKRYMNAKAQTDIYTQSMLPDSKASLDLVTSGYQQGEFDYLMFLTSQRTFFQTNLQYLDSVRELREASIELEGLLLTGSLADRSSP